MDVISILQKMKQEVSAFEVKVHADRAEEHPKVFTNIELEYIVTGKNIDRASVEKAVNLSETRYCSAQAMLRTGGSHRKQDNHQRGVTYWNFRTLPRLHPRQGLLLPLHRNRATMFPPDTPGR